MDITSTSFTNATPIPERFCFCRMDPEAHVAMADNVSPHLAWSDAPEGTRSFVLLCMDPDVPTVGDDVNQEGRTVPHDLPRCDFCHWVMVDIPADCHELAEGACSNGITAGGKTDPPGPAGARQGITNYTDWFDGDPDMGGDYHGYDGPAPPWNDERLHHYHFTIYALDIDACSVDGTDFRASDVLQAIEGHVLAQASIIGTCSLNPALHAAG
jgi:Raf kinase inhibitor-like YbhB/YbcL family protein